MCLVKHLFTWFHSLDEIVSNEEDCLDGIDYVPAFVLPLWFGASEGYLSVWDSVKFSHTNLTTVIWLANTLLQLSKLLALVTLSYMVNTKVICFDTRLMKTKEVKQKIQCCPFAEFSLGIHLPSLRNEPNLKRYPFAFADTSVRLENIIFETFVFGILRLVKL